MSDPTLDTVPSASLWAPLSSPGSLFAFAASTLLGAALCSVPLYGVHGVGSAFVLGLVVPFVAALHVAFLRSISEDKPASPLRRLPQQLRAAGALAFLHVALPSLLLALNALRIRQCEPFVGLAYIVLGPLCGTWLAALLAVPLSRLTRKPRLRLLLCALPPLLGLVDFAHSFYTTPAVFAYGHFFGYFPGPIYDTVDGVAGALLWLRCASILLALGVTGLAIAHDRKSPAGPPLLRDLRAQFAATALLGAATLQAFGPQLGFDTANAHIEATLGLQMTSPTGRCRILYHREYREALRFAEDCEVRVRQVERFFGLTQPTPITVFLFRDSAEKQALMGAAHTNIAKPWRNEIYLQESGAYPHPVMAHEIAHIVAGQVGIGPFRIAGSLGGVWPNPGLVEGMATAADPRPVGDLTPHQWARAALDADLAPPLTSLLSAGFFNQQAQLAYTLTGSFLRFVHDTMGRKPLLRFYHSSDPLLAFGTSLPRLEERWHSFLRKLDMPDVATALARQRFMGGSALSAVCPNELTRLSGELWSDLRRGDWVWAQRQCRAMLDIDPRNLAVRSTLAAVAAKTGNFPAAQRELQRMKDDGAAESLLSDTQQRIADAHYYHHHFDAALAGYDALLAAPQSRDNRRQLQVKRIGLTGGPEQRRILRDLLIGKPPHTMDLLPEPTDALLAAYLARELRSHRRDGLPHYLEARQHLSNDHLESAIDLLRTALARGLPTPELTLEARRILAAGLLRLSDNHLAEARALYRQLLKHDLAAIRWEAEDALQRLEILHRITGPEPDSLTTAQP